MNIKFLNSYLEKYKKIIDDISDKNNYDINLKHLLYVIITAFVIRYGMDKEAVIVDCFNKTKIYFSNYNDDNIHAFFDRQLSFNKKYFTNKIIVINKNASNNYIEYLDTIIHEFNHAINSMLNEIKEDSDKIYLRTGLSYAIYDKKNLNNSIGKSNEYILEEIINTRQTEEIIDIIISFNSINIEDAEISNFLYSINMELSSKRYVSSAYSLEKQICNNLVNNRTFLKTIEELRFKGEIDVINDWFDDIVGVKGQYKELNKLLCKIFALEREYLNRKMFKRNIMRKIIAYRNSIFDIINDFNNNSVYK